MLKQVVEKTLLHFGFDRIVRRAHAGDTLVLAYHNVVPAGHEAVGDRSLHVHQRVFAAQMDSLLSTHDVVPLAALENSAANASRPRAVITFDDAYHGALTAGLEELRRRGIPATVFVAPALFGKHTWWDRLADSVGGTLPRSVREEALTVHAGSAARIHNAFGSGNAALPHWAAIVTEAELRAAVSSGQLTIGSHSWSHANLASLASAAVADELSRSLSWVQGFSERARCWLAYPYGMHSRQVASIARDTGYAGAFLVRFGWLAPGNAAGFELPRLNIPAGLSPDGFRLRVAGVIDR